MPTATDHRRAILADIFRALMQAGWYAARDTDTVDSILTDGDDLHLRLMKGRDRAMILIMPGLENCEMIADYSCKLESIIEPITDRYDRMTDY